MGGGFLMTRTTRRSRCRLGNRWVSRVDGTRYERCGCSIGVKLLQAEAGFAGGSNSSSNRTGEEDQVSIGIGDYEGCGAPGFVFEGLLEGNVLDLIHLKELFDLVCAGDGD